MNEEKRKEFAITIAKDILISRTSDKTLADREIDNDMKNLSRITQKVYKALPEIIPKDS